jgi:dUTP diphosphatase
MNEQQVPVRLCWLAGDDRQDLYPPGYATTQAAGMDVQAAVDDSLTIQPGQRVLVPTGFSVALPRGYELQVRPRSGMAVKYGVTILNSPGTIDADYRGEIKIALINLGEKPYVINRGDRIGQLVLAPVERACIEVVASLDRTDRDLGGFGHTGV